MPMTNEEIELLKAQAAVTLHVAERLVLLQVAFEAFLRQDDERCDEGYQSHLELRRKMLDEDMEGKTTLLLNTLKQAMEKL